MQVTPKTLQFALAYDLPSVVEVRGTSMSPTFALGDRLEVHPVRGTIGVGEIALVITSDGAELLVHRVMHVFQEAGRTLVVHQGDAPDSTFAICPREAVIATVTAFATVPPRPLPTRDLMSAGDWLRFQARRQACRGFCAARKAAKLLDVAERPLARAAARLYKTAARSLAR